MTVAVVERVTPLAPAAVGIKLVEPYPGIMRGKAKGRSAHFVIPYSEYQFS